MMGVLIIGKLITDFMKIIISPVNFIRNLIIKI